MCLNVTKKGFELKTVIIGYQKAPQLENEPSFFFFNEIIYNKFFFSKESFIGDVNRI